MYGNNNDFNNKVIRSVLIVCVAVVIGFFRSISAIALPPSGTASMGKFWGFGMVIVVIGIMYSIFLFTDKVKNKTGVEPEAIAYEIPDFAMKSLDEYQKKDPAFNVADIVDFCSELFMKLQQCRSEKDYSPVRANLTEMYYSSCEQEAQEMEFSNVKCYVESYAIKDIVPRGYFQKAGSDHLVVRVRGTVKDYTINLKSGKLTGGNKEYPKFIVFEWILSRRMGLKTNPPDKVLTMSCPNCGAPLNVQGTVKCPYCGSTVAAMESDWKLNSSKIITLRYL